MRADDIAIEQRALDALRGSVSVPRGKVTVTVDDGWQTLEGDVEWNHEKRAAGIAVRDLFGVRGITDRIVVKPRVRAVDVKRAIDEALRRGAGLDAQHIIVDTTGDTVVLRGEVRSWAEHEDAVHAASSAPGVSRVEDHLAIRA
jgi:osmotically-inducible protein OsmY